MLETPVLFLIFNRPDTTEQVFAKIREARPKQLFVAADGPRIEKTGEAEKCEIVRQIAINVDWDCEVKTLFRKDNLGCGLAVSQAITWFFEHVEQGIILEDDVLPDLSFFEFCRTLLDKYHSNLNVMTVCGTNFLNYSPSNGSYYFSRNFHAWGWATWKRSWQSFSLQLENYDYFKNYQSRKLWKNSKERNHWLKIFNQVNSGSIDSWDYSMSYLIFRERRLSIIPTVNLIRNIGFNADATHTKVGNNKLMPTVGRLWEIKHPDKVLWNQKIDKWQFKFFHEESVKEKVKRKIQIFLK